MLGGTFGTKAYFYLKQKSLFLIEVLLIHFLSQTFPSIFVISALSRSGHPSRCTIKSGRAAVLPPQRRLSDANAHPEDEDEAPRMDVALMVPRKTALTSPGVTGLICEIGFESATAPCRGGWGASGGDGVFVMLGWTSSLPHIIRCLCHISLSIGWLSPKMRRPVKTDDADRRMRRQFVPL